MWFREIVYILMINLKLFGVNDIHLVNWLNFKFRKQKKEKKKKKHLFICLFYSGSFLYSFTYKNSSCEQRIYFVAWKDFFFPKNCYWIHNMPIFYTDSWIFFLYSEWLNRSCNRLNFLIQINNDIQMVWVLKETIKTFYSLTSLWLLYIYNS